MFAAEPPESLAGFFVLFLPSIEYIRTVAFFASQEVDQSIVTGGYKAPLITYFEDMAAKVAAEPGTITGLRAPKTTIHVFNRRYARFLIRE